MLGPELESQFQHLSINYMTLEKNNLISLALILSSVKWEIKIVPVSELF